MSMSRLQAEWWVSSGKQLPDITVEETPLFAEILGLGQHATDGLTCQASEQEDSMDWYSREVRQLFTGSTQCERQLCGKWDPGTHSSLSYPFNGGGCARPCCGIASSSCLLRSTALETTHRMLRNKVGTCSFSSAHATWAGSEFLHSHALGSLSPDKFQWQRLLGWRLAAISAHFLLSALLYLVFLLDAPDSRALRPQDTGEH